jgi:6-phosphogluconolactonase (cycloisomerase 2 family)
MDSTSSVLFTANQGSANISAFTVGSSSGTLTPVFGTSAATGSGPAFITMDATNKFLYIGNQGSNNITAYSVNVDCHDPLKHASNLGMETNFDLKKLGYKI